MVARNAALTPAARAFIDCVERYAARVERQTDRQQRGR
jgi:hypothetical protein